MCVACGVSFPCYGPRLRVSEPDSFLVLTHFLRRRRNKAEKRKLGAGKGNRCDRSPHRGVKSLKSVSASVDAAALAVSTLAFAPLLLAARSGRGERRTWAQLRFKCAHVGDGADKNVRIKLRNKF